ncbi:hypothetical protein K0B04_02370, partial [Patescibacteria group bacterium]|nr:hypothetical protein [Patescibacteria group bacterium]
MKKTFRSIVIFSILISLIFNLFAPYFVSYAEEGFNPYTDICKPEEMSYAKAIKFWSLDIRRTVDNFVTSIIVSLVSVFIGVSPNALMACQSAVRSKMADVFGGSSFASSALFDTELPRTCDTEGTSWDESMCDELSGSFGGPKVTSQLPIETLSVRGSMLGMSNMLEGFVKNEPLPVNLAFMW